MAVAGFGGGWVVEGGGGWVGEGERTGEVLRGGAALGEAGDLYGRDQLVREAWGVRSVGETVCVCARACVRVVRGVGWAG